LSNEIQSELLLKISQGEVIVLRQLKAFLEKIEIIIKKMIVNMIFKSKLSRQINLEQLKFIKYIHSLSLHELIFLVYSAGLEKRIKSEFKKNNIYTELNVILKLISALKGVKSQI
jgi:hypothetical protein